MFIICSIEDTKAEEFRGLYLQRTQEAAVRMFHDAIIGGNGSDSMLRRHPEDYQLVQVGNFDEESGRIEIMDPLVLMTADRIVQRYQRDKPATLPGQLDLTDAIIEANGNAER